MIGPPLPGWGFGVLATLTALGALALSAIHVAWTDQRIVVFRYGQLLAVRGPGITIVWPGLERGVRVSLRPSCLDLLWLRATTADGAVVTVNGMAEMAVSDPATYAARLLSAATPPRPATSAAAAAALREFVAHRTLAELSRTTGGDVRAPAAAAGARTREWGVAIRRVELSRIELSADDNLLRWAERYAAASARRTP